MLFFGRRNKMEKYSETKLTSVIQNCFWIIHVVDIDTVIAYPFVTNKFIMPP